MSIFDFFKKKKKESLLDENNVLKVGQEGIMEPANNARDTFKYFWRELYWENKRIVKGLNFAAIKIAFSQETLDGENIIENMWIDDIYFDGDVITGRLVNKPNELTNVQENDIIEFEIDDIIDWLYAIGGETFGGFTVQAIRSTLSEEDRVEYDKAWGLNFGDYNEILLVSNQKENPENLIEHPLSIAMKDKMEEFLKENPGEVSFIDEDGLTLLHKEAIVGNKTMVEVLLKFGADKNIKSKSNKTAYDYAKQMNWEHIVEILK
ncbi:DUF2314 domain-containing protein [Oceanivirga salmonicida]|uniref:DUF2314 domain-containing protein n=1 Tax=Oceanivirga salmonicida TaxID=1769291 RepID=UPI0009EB316A|nr:DUF2314 domain-containing protein [Oceanivirga salmonicida]